MSEGNLSPKERRERYLLAAGAAAQVREGWKWSKKLGHELRKASAKEIEDLRKRAIADLQRVADHPDNNSLVTPVSRDCYRDLGHFPIQLIYHLFGSLPEALRAADLEELRGTKTVLHRGARLHTEQSIARFAQQNVTRYHGQHDKGVGKRKHVEGILASDWHSRFCNPFALRVLCDTVRMVQPDYIGVVGDLVDFPTFSTHPNFPGHFGLSSWDEAQWARKALQVLRELAPDAQIDFIIGNHEYRLVRFLADTRADLHEWPTFDFSEVFGLNEQEINLVCRSNFLAPTAKARKRDIRENWVILGDGSYCVTHGTKIAKHAAAAEMMGAKMSGASGHVHRPGIAWDRSPGTGPISWMSLPCMSSITVGNDYMPSYNQWNQGFGRFALYPKKHLVDQQLVIVHEEWATYAGATWHIKNAERRQLEAMVP